jgi:OPA family glycerol-3-phosphate transporter-like MFS transporter
MYFQSFGSMSIIKVKAYWFHVRERGVFGAIFGTLISIGIYMASIGITSLMSGTAATDFGGRKATATCMGIVNGFAYLGSCIQSFCLGYLLEGANVHWLWLPIFVIPFAIIGLLISIKIWHELPAATRKYITEVEQKKA